jgi:hypothetical protein
MEVELFTYKDHYFIFKEGKLIGFSSLFLEEERRR